ncbi:MAG: cytochrome c [Actinomycetota bacterium]|nr:cytochrome c [Actinomycetota bacterium]
MKKSLLTWAIIMIVLGLMGLVFVLATTPAQPDDAFTSNGQMIYYTGASRGGQIPRTVGGAGMMGPGMMGASACVDCHGEDGRGGQVDMMYQSTEIPDIRYSSLTSPHTEDETETPGWTDAEIARAIREGIEPDGNRIKSPMPRWNMTDAEISDVIDYLKELDTR